MVSKALYFGLSTLCHGPWSLVRREVRKVGPLSHVPNLLNSQGGYVFFLSFFVDRSTAEVGEAKHCRVGYMLWIVVGCVRFNVAGATYIQIGESEPAALLGVRS